MAKHDEGAAAHLSAQSDLEEHERLLDELAERFADRPASSEEAYSRDRFYSDDD